MVKDFYSVMGFTKISEDEQGSTVWEFAVDESYKDKQNVITIRRSQLS